VGWGLFKRLAQVVCYLKGAVCGDGSLQALGGRGALGTDALRQRPLSLASIPSPPHPHSSPSAQLALYDIANVAGVAADLSHCNTAVQV